MGLSYQYVICARYLFRFCFRLTHEELHSFRPLADRYPYRLRRLLVTISKLVLLKLIVLTFFVLYIVHLIIFVVQVCPLLVSYGYTL